MLSSKQLLKLSAILLVSISMIACGGKKKTNPLVGPGGIPPLGTGGFNLGEFECFFNDGTNTPGRISLFLQAIQQPQLTFPTFLNSNMGTINVSGQAVITYVSNAPGHMGQPVQFTYDSNALGGGATMWANNFNFAGLNMQLRSSDGAEMRLNNVNLVVNGSQKPRISGSVFETHTAFELLNGDPIWCNN